MKKKPAKRRTPKVPDAVEELRARMARSAKQVNALLRGIEEDVREVMEELLHARREREAVAALRARAMGAGLRLDRSGKGAYVPVDRRRQHATRIHPGAAVACRE